MSHRRILSAGALALGSAIAMLCMLAPSATGAPVSDLCVDSYGSIQGAINAADPGDVVLIPVDNYLETLEISETITLQGGWNAGCTARVTDDPAQTVIDANQAGSVVVIDDGEPELEGLTITGGWSNRGGGLYIHSASATLSHVVVTGNVISSTVDERTSGAGVYLNLSDLVLNHTDIVSNVGHAPEGQLAMGGGVYMKAYGRELTLSSSRIMHNVKAPGTRLDGAGVFISDGAVFAADGGTSTIAHNSGTYGAGVYMYGDAMLSGVTVAANVASSSGGGVYVTQFYGGHIANSVFTANSAKTRGSGIYVIGTDFDIANSTFVSNTGGTNIAVEVNSSGTPAVTLTNNIIVGHRIGIYNRHTAISPTLLSNDVWHNETNYSGLLTGTSDVHIEPHFADGAGGDFHLADGSQLIDAGTNLGWLVRDFDGDPRSIGVSHDIGADEWGLFVFLPHMLRDYAP